MRVAVVLMLVQRAVRRKKKLSSLSEDIEFRVRALHFKHERITCQILTNGSDARSSSDFFIFITECHGTHGVRHPGMHT